MVCLISYSFFLQIYVTWNHIWITCILINLLTLTNNCFFHFRARCMIQIGGLPTQPCQVVLLVMASRWQAVSSLVRVISRQMPNVIKCSSNNSSSNNSLDELAIWTIPSINRSVLVCSIIWTLWIESLHKCYTWLIIVGVKLWPVCVCVIPS